MSIISDISQQKQKGIFKKYINFIRFPFYRNLDLNTIIHFNFPLTVFIGQNGCGKSSALQALWGAVKGNTPYRFWFDTKVDPIQYLDDEKKRPSFWYSYTRDDDSEKEVLKQRIHQAGNPNYWETARPVLSYGMKNLDGKRNQPVEKNVVYLDFRSELSAFDQYFYFGDTKNSNSKNKQEFIRKQSSKLKPLFDGKKEFQYSGGSKSTAQNHRLIKLSKKELEIISFIIGRKYEDGKIIKHKLFRNEGYSVLLKTSFAQYSEAFAGSGEVAVVRLVTEILKAEPYSLILLDEPEVSLHPGAQVRLQEFLLSQIKSERHQVILNTHSPTLIQGLPKDSIKVFYLNLNTKRFAVKENLYPEEAFFHIEYEVEKKKIFVEDKLAKNIIEAVLKDIGEEKLSLFNVQYHPGGVSVLKQDMITVFCRNDNPYEFVFFDGDQKLSEPIDWRELTNRELNANKLANIIKEQTGEDIKFKVDSLGKKGRGNNRQKIELRKKYLDFYLNNVFYFPYNTPEQLIWNEEHAKALLKLHGKESIFDELTKYGNFKNKFKKLSLEIAGKNDSNSIEYLQNQFIRIFLNNKGEDYSSLVMTLEAVIDKINQ